MLYGTFSFILYKLGSSDLLLLRAVPGQTRTHQNRNHDHDHDHYHYHYHHHYNYNYPKQRQRHGALQED